MPKFIKENDKSHISGMDTVRDFRADTFPSDKNLLMRNIFPGDPPMPRNGCQDVMVDITPLGYGDNATLFKPPAIVTRDPINRNLFVFVWHIYEWSSANYYALEVWDISGGTRKRTIFGKWLRFANFGLLNQYGKVFGFTNYDMSESYVDDNGNTSQGLRHKILDFDGTNWNTRDLCIDKYAILGVPVVEVATAGLTGGLWVNYAATYVRRDPLTDTDGYSGGVPVETNVFSPGDNEGYERLDDRRGVDLSTFTTVTYGHIDTEFSINEITTGELFRIEWNGIGTNPYFSGLSEGDWVHCEGTNFFGVNEGRFKIARVYDGSNLLYDYIEIYNKSGAEQAPFTLGTSNAIKTENCQVNIPMPSDADTTEAVGWGATHLRIWRTDHALNAEVAEGLVHRFLVDIPISGPNLIGYQLNGVIDSTTRNTLEGETNFLVMTNYTAAPLARFACYNAFRLFLGGGAKRGRWYYTEAPGVDGGTTLADIFPLRYMSMFKPTLYYVDCDPENGQADTGCAVLRDDNYFFKEKSCYMLHNGDAKTAPDEVSNHLGCVFPNTLIVADMPKLGTFIFFISAEGPCIITPGGSIHLLGHFSIKELWPGGELLNKTDGELMTEYIREKVHAKVHQNTIWVLYGDSEDTESINDNPLTENHVFGYYEGAEKPFGGCLEIDFTDFSIYFHATKTVTAQKGTHSVFKNPWDATVGSAIATSGMHTLRIDDQIILTHSVKVVTV